jgi:hypothetical protein
LNADHLYRDLADLSVESIPEMLPELNMVRMEVPTARSLDAKYCLKTAERNPKRGIHGISPIGDACNVTGCLIHMDIILIVLNYHGLVGPEEKWKPLADLVQLGKFGRACENTRRVTQKVA